ncbi:MAG: sialidase family protein [Victivallales bacterium]
MEITVLTLNHDLNGGYFHPRASVLPDGGLVMTLQSVGGSDYFGPVRITYSRDEGNSWTKPCDIPALGWKEIGDGVTEGVCDVIPDYHAVSGKALAIGHNVYYRNGRFCDTLGDFRCREASPQLRRVGVYSVNTGDGRWSERKPICWEEFREYNAFMCGCSQKVILPDGRIIIPFSIGCAGRGDRSFCSLLCDFDGEEIKALKRGNILELEFGRGLLEPSLVFYNGVFFATLRAEDGHGYVSVSVDGLNWEPLRPWRWEDGSALTMSTTQQHWLKLGGRLYLVYTRKNGENDKIPRWRAPLFIAEVDTVNFCLKGDTEQIVFPMRPHPENPDAYGMVGNFHTLALSETEAIVTTGELYPQMEFETNTLLARLTL